MIFFWQNSVIFYIDMEDSEIARTPDQINKQNNIFYWTFYHKHSQYARSHLSFIPYNYVLNYCINLHVDMQNSQITRTSLEAIKQTKKDLFVHESFLLDIHPLCRIKIFIPYNMDGLVKPILLFELWHPLTHNCVKCLLYYSPRLTSFMIRSLKR